MEQKVKNYGVLMNSDDTFLNQNWEDPSILAIESHCEILLGDTITYVDHKLSERILKDFKTLLFIVDRREHFYQENRNKGDFVSPILFLKPFGSNKIS